MSDDPDRSADRRDGSRPSLPMRDPARRGRHRAADCTDTSGLADAELAAILHRLTSLPDRDT